MSNTTRQVITISLPPAMVKEVRATVKKEGYASVSEYVRDLVRERERAKLAKEFKAMSRDFDRGGKKYWSKIKSLDDIK